LNNLEDVLNSTLDTVADVSTVLRNQRKSSSGRNINPFDHYEVECGRLTTLFVGEDLKDAQAVFSESQSQVKALIRVRGRERIVLLTNAPFMYMIEQKRETVHDTIEA